MKLKKLVFYSGGQERSNHIMHRSLVSLVNPKPRIKFTYIPFCSDGSKVFYRRAIRRYSCFGISDFHYLSVDHKISESDLEEALRSDIIYLAGGNTFYFLKHLKKSGILPMLRAFVESGGVLSGLSAGGIIMSPNIRLAGYPSFECDENDVGLKNLKSLKLVNFEFFPHYRKSKKLNDALSFYSETSKYPVYACKDGGGLIVNGNQKTFFGETVIFDKGSKIIV